MAASAEHKTVMFPNEPLVGVAAGAPRTCGCVALP